MAQSQQSQRRSIEPILQEMVRRIVRVARPEKIILFGSAARGDMGPDSDVDLLVVVPGPARRRSLAGELYMALGDVGVAKDIVVVTAEDVERYKDDPGLIVQPALEEGRTLYEAPRRPMAEVGSAA